LTGSRRARICEPGRTRSRQTAGERAKVIAGANGCTDLPMCAGPVHPPRAQGRPPSSWVTSLTGRGPGPSSRGLFLAYFELALPGLAEPGPGSPGWPELGS
jgi:hypothetical protein